MSIDIAALRNKKQATEEQKAPVGQKEQKVIKQEKVFNIYKSTMRNHKLIRQDGKAIHVINGELVTADKKDIEYLDAEIEAGFPYLKPAEQITSTELDPMASLRAKMKDEARLELLAEQVKADKDMGFSKSKVIPASTVDLTAVSGESTSK